MGVTVTFSGRTWGAIEGQFGAGERKTGDEVRDVGVARAPIRARVNLETARNRHPVNGSSVVNV